jgi:hypothetical protein
MLCQCGNFLITSGNCLSRAKRRRGAERECWLGVVICRCKDKLLKRRARRAGAMSGALESPIMPSFYKVVEAGPLAWLFPVRPVSVVLMLLLALLVEPTGDVTRWNCSSWEVRVNGAGVDDQSLVKFRSREVLGFPFSLKCPGCSRASPSKQCTASVQLESNIPSIRHLSPKDDASGDVIVAADNSAVRSAPLI